MEAGIAMKRVGMMQIMQIRLNRPILFYLIAIKTHIRIAACTLVYLRPINIPQSQLPDSLSLVHSPQLRIQHAALRACFSCSKARVVHPN